MNPTYIPTFLNDGNIITIGVGADSAYGNRTGYAIGSYGAHISTYGATSTAGKVESPIGIPADVVNQIDKKIDDGLPSSGNFGIFAGDIGCAANSIAYPSSSTVCRVTAGKKIH